MPRYEVVSPFFGPHIGTDADFIGLRQKGANLGFQLDQKFLCLLSNSCPTRDSVATVKSGQKVTKFDNNSIWNICGTNKDQKLLVRSQFVDY